MEELSESEKIRLLLDYALPLKEDYFSNRDPLVPKKVYCKAVEIFGFSAAPTIVEDEKFKDYGFPTLYRGVTQKQHQRELIQGSEYFVRDSFTFDIDAFGIYSSTQREKALEYTKESPESSADPDLILHLKVAKSARITDRSMLEKHYRSLQGQGNFDAYLERRLSAALSDLSQEDRDYMFSLFYNYHSILAVLLGYDGVMTEFDDQNYYCVFNRGKMLIPKSDADYFCGKGQTPYSQGGERGLS